MTEGPAALGTALRLRPADEADTMFLYRLEEACMRDYALALWGRWTVRPAEHFFIAEHRIVTVSGHDVGCLAVRDCGGHLWLDKLYIAPGAQSRGIGSRVVGIVKAEARAAGKPLRLHVLRTNPALTFYLRHGFAIRGRTDEVYALSD